MNSKISKEVEIHYHGNMSDIELIEKYFYKKSNLWKEFIWFEWFELQHYSEPDQRDLIDEFKSLEILKSKNDFWLISLDKKLLDKYKWEKYLDDVFIMEPYTFQSIWKTKFWYDMHEAKWNSEIKVIKYFAEQLYNHYQKLHEVYRFDWIWFIPPTLKWRKIQIMDFVKDYFLVKDENLKILNICKIDGMPSQKSLSKFDDRMENAKNSFYIWEKKYNLWNILLIDDALWSGTTLNFVWEKLKKENEVNKIIWLSIIWSMRGFDIIKEI